MRGHEVLTDPRLDLDAVRASVREHAAECEARAAQVVAEARAHDRPLRLRDQEARAAWSDNAEACTELLKVLEQLHER